MYIKISYFPNFFIQSDWIMENFVYLCDERNKPKMMDKLFFELIRVSTGQLDCLSRGAEPEEWQELYQLAHQHQLAGVCYRGAQALFEFGLRVPHELIIDWMAEAEQIEEQNALLTQRCIEVQQLLLTKNFKSSVLMGQGVARDYSESLQMLRQPDGTDLLVTGDKAGVQALLDTWDDEEIQLHDSIETSKNPYRKWVLDRWFEKNDKALFVKDGEMVRPSASMNLIFQLIRLYRLFLYQGITLRDLMDFFFALKRVAGHGRASTINYEKVIKSLGLLGFSRGVIWVMQEVFGLGEEEQIVKPLESQGTFILHEVMAGRHRFFRLAMKHPVEMLCSLLP